MNRTYRVVYNHSTGTYVAVAENTTVRKKSSTTVKAIVTALSMSAVMMGVSTAAHASFVSDDAVKPGNGATNYVIIGPGAAIKPAPENGNIKPNQSIAIGAEALVTGDQSTALGNNVIASGHSSVAIGGDDVNAVIDAAGNEYKDLTGVTLVKSQWQSTQSGGHGSIAIGVQSQAMGNFSTALGLTSRTQGTGAVAFGANAQGLDKGATSIGTASTASGQQATAIGMNSTATAKNSTAIGSGGNTPATATKATADGAIAIGGNSIQGSQATGKNAIAIGGQSVASVDNAVAIGAGSKSTHGNSVALGVNSVADGANIGKAAYQPLDASGNPIAVAGTATGEVSIGKAGSERRITNMAAGSADTDGVNVSQLKALNSSLTGKMDVLGNNITTLGSKVTTMQTSISTLEQGWKLQSDGDAASAVKAGNTVAINSGSNIDVSRTGNTITVATAKDMTLNSVSFSDTAGNNSVLSASGLNVSNSKTGNSVSYGSDALTFTKDGNTANAVSVGSNGISAGNQTISNVGNGALTATSKEAVNGSQLYQTNQVLNQTNQQVNQNTADIANLSQGWKLQSDGDAASSVLAGDTVQINSGKNIDVSRNGNTLTIATADDLNLNSVTLQDASGNSSVINGNQLVFNPNTANAVSIGNTGVNAGNQTITNVGDGAITSSSKEAINGSQLYDIQQEMQEHIKKAEDEAGLLGSLAVQYDSTDKNHITLGGVGAANAVGISNLADGKVEAGSKDAVNGGQLYAVDQKVDQNSSDIAHLSQGWKLQSDGDTASSVLAGDTVQFNSGKNIEVSRDGNTLTIATADDLNLNSVNLQDASGATYGVLDASGLNVSNSSGSEAHYGAEQLVFNPGSANAVSVGETGISAGNQIISNVAAGDISTATSTDAVNGGQLYQTNQNIADNKNAIDQLSQGWKLQSDGDVASSVKAGDTVQINSGKNIDVSRVGNTLTIATSDDMVLTSVTTVDGSGKSSVLDAGGLQVDSGNGAWASYGAGSSIINDGQGNQTSTNASGTEVQDAAGNTTQVNSKGMVLLNKDGTQLASLNQQQLSFSNGTPGSNVSIGLNGISAGSQKVTNVADGTLAANSQDAVNGSQLYQTNQNVTDLDNKVADLSQGWNLQSDGDNASAVHAGDTVAINSGKNIDVSRVGNGITINTSDDLVVNSVVADDGAGNTMTLNAGGLALQDALGNVNLQTAANNTLISNNFSNVTTALGSNLSDGQNTAQYLVGGAVLNNANGDTTVITGAGMSAFDQDGNHTDYGSNGLVINNAGNTITISNGDINFGGNTLSNVAAGVTAGDAVNKGQLDQVGNSTANALGGSSSYDAATGTVNAGLAVGGTTFTTVQAALDAVNQQANAGWKVSTEKGTTYTVAPNATVDFSNNDDNVVIKNTNGDITIDLAKDVNLGSVTADDGQGNKTVLNAAGTQVEDALGNNATYGANGVSIADAAGNQTTNIGAGNVNVAGTTYNIAIDGNTGEITGLSNTQYDPNNIQADRAATEGQIADLDQQLTNKGFNISANGGAGDTVKLGETVDFTNSDGNIEISNNVDNGIQFKLANAISVQSVTADDGQGNKTVLNTTGTQVEDAQGNNATYGANGISISNTAGNTITIADGKVNFGGNTLSGIGAGVNADDAVNKGQLDNLGNNLADNIFGGNAQYDGNTITWSNIGGTGANTVDSAITAVNNKVNLGWNAADTAGNTFNVAAGQTVGFVNKDGNIDITAAGSSLTFALAKDINVNSVTADDGQGNKTVLNTAGTQVEDAHGNNATYGANGISISNTAGNTITIADGKVNFGGNTLSGIGAGVNADDAVNKGQLDNLGNNLADNIFGGNAQYDGNTITWSNIGGTGANTVDSAITAVNDKVNLGWNAADTAGNTFNVAAGQTVGFVNKDGNIDITAAGSSLTFDLAKDINVNSVTADDGQGNKTVLNTAGTQVEDAHGNSATYGANGSSFTDLAGNRNISNALGNTLADIAGNTYSTTAAGSVLTNAAGDKTELTAAGTQVEDALGNNATYGANGISIADAAGNVSTNIGAGSVNVAGNTYNIAIDGNTGEITGLSNTKYDPNNIQADRAATEGQIADLDNKISNAGFNISAQGGAGDTVTVGETVDFASADGNLTVSNDVDNQILLTLSSDLNLNSVSMQDALGNVNYVDATGSRVQDALGNNAFYGAIGNQFTDKAGNSFSSSAGGSHISNAKGDVTNVTASGTQVSDAAGNNANYGATGNTMTNAAGDSTNVSAGNITVSNGNGGSVSIGGSGIDAGGNQITNVADGKAAGDAVNKGQLDQAIADVNNSIGAANNSGVQYDKNADGTINKDSITLGGGANGTTITNVADGKVAAGSKDAINGGQLHDALQQMQDNQTNINNDILGITVGPDGKPKLDLDIYDVSNQTKTGDLTLVDAINTVNQEGTKYAHTNAADESEEPGLLNPDNNSASAGGKNSSAFGVNAIVDDSATNGLAMGYQSKVGEGATDSVSVGSKTEANGKSSVAMGHGSKANGDNSISIGTGNEVNGDRSGAIGDPSIINGNDSYSIGNNNKIDADNSFVLGNEVTIGKDATDMSKANGATFGGSVGLGNGSSVDAAVGTKNITIGDTTYDFAGSAPVGTISVGSKDAERTITNVAAGRIDANSTDAINGSQLYATNQAVDSLIKGESGPVQYVKDGNGKAQNVLNLKGDADSYAPVTLSNVADGKAANDAVNLGQMQKMGDKINARIDGLEDESRAGVATALAVANLPQVYLPGKSGLAIATGVHKGEVGYALGYSSISEGGNWVFKASATANRMGDVGGGAGLLYMFD